jgi:hypothetical protein
MPVSSAKKDNVWIGPKTITKKLLKLQNYKNICLIDYQTQLSCEQLVVDNRQGLGTLRSHWVVWCNRPKLLQC